MKIKIVFYKSLLQRGKNLSFNEKILYSFLLSKTISGLGVISSANEDEEKKLDLDELYSILEENYNWLECYSISKSKIADTLKISRPIIIASVQHLIKEGYLMEYNDKLYILANKELVEHGYFELIKKKGLKGELLIFYSYLCDKTKQTGSRFLNITKKQMALDFGNKDGYLFITKLLNRLYDLHLVERLEHNILKVNK